MVSLRLIARYERRRQPGRRLPKLVRLLERRAMLGTFIQPTPQPRIDSCISLGRVHARDPNGRFSAQLR